MQLKMYQMGEIAFGTHTNEAGRVEYYRMVPTVMGDVPRRVTSINFVNRLRKHVKYAEFKNA